MRLGMFITLLWCQVMMAAVQIHRPSNNGVKSDSTTRTYISIPVTQEQVACEDGWMLQPGGTSCYFIGNKQREVNYDTAVQTCLSMGARPVIIESQEENEYIANIASTNIAYIGLRKGVLQWTWPTGSADVLENWAPGEPGSLNCAYLASNGRWFGANCSGDAKTWYYMCERPLTTYLICPNVWKRMCYNGYYTVTSIDYHAAKVRCTNANAELVTITTLAENRFVTSILHPSLSSLIGLKRENTTWQWHSTDTEVLDNWAADDVSDGGSCAAISSDGKWRIASCNQSKQVDSYICEKRAQGIKRMTNVPAIKAISTNTSNDLALVGISDESEMILPISIPTAVALFIIIVVIVWRLHVCRQITCHHTETDEVLQLSQILKDMLDDEVKLKMESLLLRRAAIDVQEMHGQGAFGIVYKGTHTHSEDVHNVQTVAIKTLKANCIGSQIRDLADEAYTMSSFNHIHVLSIIGICIRPEDGTPMLILPFMDNGDLKTYLRKFTHGKTAPEPPDVKQLLTFCLHVARGMEYLSGQKFVHRDLAARNCMLDVDLVTKIADFGLTRDIYTSSYYTQDQQKFLPIKWMAPESLQYRRFTCQTDVPSLAKLRPRLARGGIDRSLNSLTIDFQKTIQWSFGVTMWEVLTLGMEPYPQLDNMKVPSYLRSGGRLERPDNSSDAMYDVMLSCWEDAPEERSRFGEISNTLSEYLAKINDYVELNEGTRSKLTDNSHLTLNIKSMVESNGGSSIESNDTVNMESTVNLNVELNIELNADSILDSAMDSHVTLDED